MIRFLTLIFVCFMFAGCDSKPKLVQIEYDSLPLYSSIPEFHNIKYMDLNSITTSGWNKKKVTVVVKYPLDERKNFNYIQEFDCGQHIVRNIEVNWTGDWHIVEQKTLENIR